MDRGKFQAIANTIKAEVTGEPAEMCGFMGPNISLPPRIGSALPSAALMASTELAALYSAINTIITTEQIGAVSPATPALQLVRALLQIIQTMKQIFAPPSTDPSTAATVDHMLLLIKELHTYLRENAAAHANKVFKEYVKLLARVPQKTSDSDSTTFRLTCETGYSGSLPRRWLPVTRWHVWVSCGDPVQQLHTKLRAVSHVNMSIQALLHASSPAVRLTGLMHGLDLTKTLEENGVTPNSIIRWHNGMVFFFYLLFFFFFNLLNPFYIRYG